MAKISTVLQDIRVGVPGLLLMALVLIGGVGIVVLISGSRPARPQSPSLAQSPPQLDARHANSADTLACNTFAAINLVFQPDSTGLPDPEGTTSTRPLTDFIGLADALSNTAQPPVSASLGSALTTYTYALASLGASTNHHDPGETVEGLHQLTEMAGSTVIELCRSLTS